MTLLYPPLMTIKQMTLSTAPRSEAPFDSKQMALSAVQNKALCDLIEHELEEMVRPHLVALGLQPIAVRMRMAGREHTRVSWGGTSLLLLSPSDNVYGRIAPLVYLVSKSPPPPARSA